jgi:hypothetical protein
MGVLPDMGYERVVLTHRDVVNDMCKEEARYKESV